MYRNGLPVNTEAYIDYAKLLAARWFELAGLDDPLHLDKYST